MPTVFPSHREPTATESRVLEAALQVFAEKGLHGASTQDISSVAGVSKSTLHYYYRHKEELYERVFENVFTEMFVPLRETLVPGLGLRENLEAFIGFHVRDSYEKPEMVRLWMQENLIGAPVARRVTQKFNAREDSPFRIFVENLQDAIDRGESRPVDPLQTLVTAMGSVFFLPLSEASMVATLEVLGGQPIDLDDFVAQRTEYLVGLIYHGLRVG